jgi:uncharacterized protein (TIGR03067 family)
MRTTWMTLGLAALLYAGAAASADDKPGTPDRSAAGLAGTYTIIAGEEEGQKEPPERVQGTVVRFTENTVTVTDKDKKETYVASYVLDTRKKPWKITLTTKQGAEKREEVANGLLEKDGDTVRLIYALPGGGTPTEFKTRDKQLLFVMKRTGQ